MDVRRSRTADQMEASVRQRLYSAEGFRAGGNRFMVVLAHRTLDHKRCRQTDERKRTRVRAGRFSSRLRLRPHGWRAMAVCDRRIDGLWHQEISAQLCMSLGMVMRYSKHIDQERLAREANKRRT